jgi:hypothetical protein
MPSLRIPSVVALVWGLAAWVGNAAAQVPATDAEAVQLTLAFSARTDASGLGDLRVQLRDRLTQQPVDYPPQRLAAWLQKPLPTLAEAETRCADKVRMLATSGMGRRASVDLNAHRLMAVNDDRSITFINPFLRLSNAKLEQVITLPGDVTAVLHRRDAHEVWLAMSQSNEVLVIDTDARRIKHSHALEAGATPSALVESGGAVWVAQAGRDAWLRFADASAAPQAIEAPRVQAWLALPGSQSPMGLAVNGVVTLAGHPAGGSALALPLGQAIVSAVWSPLAERAVLSLEGGELVWFDPKESRVTQRLPMPAQRVMAAFDGGRLLLTADATHWSMVDVALATVLQRQAVDAPVSNIAFSPGFAYLHSAAAAQATLLSLADLRQGRARAVRVATGSVPEPNGLVVGPVQGAQLMQPLPQGSGMYVANPLDGQIYQYAEGMMAPVGSFSNYRRSPRALLLLDDTLQAVGPGDYRATFRLPKGGAYEMVLSGVQPRFAACAPLELPPVAQPLPENRAPSLAVRLVELLADERAGGVWVRAQLVDAQGQATQTALTDLTLLAFDRRSGWQARRPMRATASGVYEALLEAPEGAQLDLRAGSVAGDLSFQAGGLGDVQVSKSVRAAK